MKTTRYTPAFVESFPTPLAAGVFYVSLEYNTCAHLCACGCGDEAVTPLSPAQWSFTYDGESISVRPSVGNWSLACKSHYVIHKGRVQWARSFSPDEISRNRARDRAALDEPNSTVDEPRDEPRASGPPPAQAAGDARRGTLRRVAKWLRGRS
ncbi:DUF6527 family protein [Nocardioides halotolerans]|uniref:DUF6527 family protein n=1 Tax=Nocardioides halotolerans TaxID=433660 RepID=UPI0012FB11D2|nr:DUF6527 family protein [Nocardioides halotolerans]